MDKMYMLILATTDL